MSLIEHLSVGFGQFAQMGPLIALVVGVALGIGVGVLPGLSASTGVALLLPFTWYLDPTTALILLGALYTAAEYGGSITAIAINTPGTPAAVATSLDGYPLAQQGRMGEALTTSIVASTFGGLVGTVVLILFAPTLAELALSFGPAEYVALGILGLTLAASLSSADYLKGAITTLLGLLISTFGQDPMTGGYRFTFGFPEMIEGIALVPALIGLFAASEVSAEVAKRRSGTPETSSSSGGYLGIANLWALKGFMALGSGIGTLIGIFPGAGATIASLISYSEARRFSRKPEMFGKGSLEAVAAAESANNASVGGALVPLLTLGIPGSGTTAVMMGALMMHGLQPGPELFARSEGLVYGLFISLIFANLVMLAFGLLGIRLWLVVMRMPKSILMTCVLGLCFIGSYAGENSLWHVGQMLAFGFLGFLLKRHGYPVATVVLGLVLGFMIETNLRRSVLLGGWEIFLERPATLVMLALAIGSVVFAVIKSRREAQSTPRAS